MFFFFLQGHSEIVQVLARVCNLEALDDHNISPLFLAAQYGKQECLEILVNAGEYVISLLSTTICCWWEIICTYFLKRLHQLPHSSSHNYLLDYVHTFLGADVNTQAADLATPLLIASQEGHQSCVEFLLDHGANPNVVCSHDWPQLAIHAAAEFGRVRYWYVISVLLRWMFAIAFLLLLK